MKALAIAVLVLAVFAAFFLIQRRAVPDRLETDGGFVGTQDFPALFAALKATGKEGAFWVVLVPGTAKGDGYAANLQFSIEDNELGMDWVLIAQSNLELKENFVRIATAENLKVREVERNGVKYLRATGGRDWPSIGKKFLVHTFGEHRTAKMQLIITDFTWRPT